MGRIADMRYRSTRRADVFTTVLLPCRHVEPRLPDVSQRAMLLAGGRDVVLDSAKEADRLAKQMQRAFKRVSHTAKAHP